MSSTKNLTQSLQNGNSSAADLMSAAFVAAFTQKADTPPKSNPVRKILNRLTRRRWLGSSKGLIVLSDEFVKTLIKEIRPDDPALARDLEQWLERRQKDGEG